MTAFFESYQLRPPRSATQWPADEFSDRGEQPALNDAGSSCDGIDLERNSAEMTVAEFVRSSFLPEYVALKRIAGQRHYQAILKHVIPPELVDDIFGKVQGAKTIKLQSNPRWPYLHNLHLTDVQPEHVQRLVEAALGNGYSTQMAKHIRNVVSAIFSHAIRQGLLIHANPASNVNLPGMQRKPSHVLTLEQTAKALNLMRYPEWEVTVIGLFTPMYVAEICGLQWKFVNLSDQTVNRGGELIHARSIYVRRQWYRGTLSDVSENRKKMLPIAHGLRIVLRHLGEAATPHWGTFVLSSRTGRPINQLNLAARKLKVIGNQLELPWLSWQVFRRTRIRLIESMGSTFYDELADAIGLTRYPHHPIRRRISN